MKNWINFYKAPCCFLITQYRFIFMLSIFAFIYLSSHLFIYLFIMCPVEVTHVHTWVLRLELWSSGLEANSFTC